MTIVGTAQRTGVSPMLRDKRGPVPAVDDIREQTGPKGPVNVLLLPEVLPEHDGHREVDVLLPERFRLLPPGSAGR